MNDLFHGGALEVAHKLKNRIRDELGFTVNDGVSTNKPKYQMTSTQYRKMHLTDEGGNTISPSGSQPPFITTDARRYSLDKAPSLHLNVTIVTS